MAQAKVKSADIIDLSISKVTGMPTGIQYFNGTTTSAAIAANFPTLNQSTTGSAATLTTTRAIYGNNFDGSAALTQAIIGTYGGTGVNNSTRTITIAGNLTHAGAFTQTFTATANTSLTLPTTGTLATLAGSEALTNKNLSGAGNTFPTFNQSTTGTAASVTGTNVVTNTNLAQMATLTIKGNSTGATANASDLTVATVKTMLNLTGTNSGDQSSIVGITGTIAQFNTAVTDADFATLAGTETLTNKTLTSPKLNASSTVGYVWTATDTLGAGNWAVATGGGGGTLEQAIIAGNTLTAARIVNVAANTLTFESSGYSDGTILLKNPDGQMGIRNGAITSYNTGVAIYAVNGNASLNSDNGLVSIYTGGTKRVEVAYLGEMAVYGGLSSTNTQGANTNQRFGAGALTATTASGANTAIGYGAEAATSNSSSGNSIAIGYLAKANSDNSTVIGAGSQANTHFTTVIGAGIGSTSAYQTLIGNTISNPAYVSVGSFLDGGLINIGYANYYNNHSNCWFFGTALNATAANQLRFGSGNAGGFVSTVHFGPDASSLANNYGPVNFVGINGDGTNIPGMAIAMKPGRGTGSASTGGSFSVWTAAPSTSGTTLNPHVERLTVAADGSTNLTGDLNMTKAASYPTLKLQGDSATYPPLILMKAGTAADWAISPYSNSGNGDLIFYDNGGGIRSQRARFTIGRDGDFWIGGDSGPWHPHGDGAVALGSDTSGNVYFGKLRSIDTPPTTTGRRRFVIADEKGMMSTVATLPEHADNAAALAAGLLAGEPYRTGDFVKIVR